MEAIHVEQRAYIVITVLRGRIGMECHSELVKAVGNNALTYRTVAWRVGKFHQGRVSTSDEQRSRRPVSVRTELARTINKQLMDENRQWTILEMASAIEKRIVHRIHHNELHLRKIASR